MDDTVRIYGITYPCGNYHLLGYTKFLAQGKSVSKGFGDYRYGRYHGICRVAIPDGNQLTIYLTGLFLADCSIKSAGRDAACGSVPERTNYREENGRCSIAGALLMITQIDNSASGKNNLWGIFLAIISVTAFSVYLIIIRSVAQKYTTVTQMKWMFLFAAIILVPLGCTEYSEQALFSASWGWSGVWELSFVAILATSVAHFLTPFGMKYLRATTVSVYMNLQPIVSSVATICVGQDSFSWDKPLAAVLVIAGAYVVSTSRAKETA